MTVQALGCPDAPKLDLAKIREDICREYGNDQGAWDSDFLLKCTHDEIIAYAIWFHGLADSFSTAHDWVAEFCGWGVESGDWEFGDRICEQVFAHTDADVQTNMFAHLCVSIYAQAVGSVQS